MSANTIKINKNKYNESGFTLMEMAIGLLVLGLLIAPALSAYNVYEKNRRLEQTTFSIDRTAIALEGYLSAYGRYPCPAPINASPGDLTYGLEQRTGNVCDFAPGTPGITRVANTETTVPALVNPNVLIGSIPFKTLNLQEDDMFDGHGGRLTYGVSEIQTNPTTYTPNEGAVGIQKIDDATGNPVSMLSSANRGHYVIVTHGYDNEGGYTSGGNLTSACTNAPLQDRENCDGDAIFLFTEKTTVSDDKIAFAGGISVTPWQYEDGNTDNVILKQGGENVIVGESGTTLFEETTALDANLALAVRNEGRDDQAQIDCASVPFTPLCLDYIDDLTLRAACAANLSAPECSAGIPDVTDIPESDGVMRVERELNPITGAEIAGTGGVITEEVCDAAGANCFDPQRIGGRHNPAVAARPAGGPYGAPFAGARYGGVTSESAVGAGDGGNLACPDGEMMVGIKNGQIICTNTITLGCPSGEQLAGIGSNGEIRCDSTPPPPCPAQTVNNSCNGTANLVGGPAGGSELVFSGRCHAIAPFDDTLADTFTTYAELETYVNGLNNAIRTASDCNLVRDRFDCTSGSYVEPPARTHEKRRFTHNFTGINNNSDAEAFSHPNYQAYNPAAPMSVHPANNNGFHDCWCREDYRIVSDTCSTGSGDRWRVQKYRCPQTWGQWVNVYDTGGTFCSCVAGTGTQNGGSCASRIPGTFDPSGVTGNVTDDTAINCPYSVSVTGSDFSACSCPARSDQLPDPSPVACPPNTTNSFVFEGITYTDVESVEHRVWNCPSVSGDLDSASEVGFWTTTTFSQTCSCNDGQSGFRTESCAADELGQRRIETRLDCSLSPPDGEFVDVMPINVLQECQSCEWTRPTTGSPSYSDTPSGRPEGSNCNCNTDTGTRNCRVPNGAGYDVFSGCSCQPI